MSQAQRLMSMVAAPLSSSNLKQALLVFYVMRSALTDPCFNLKLRLAISRSGYGVYNPEWLRPEVSTSNNPNNIDQQKHRLG